MQSTHYLVQQYVIEKEGKWWYVCKKFYVISKKWGIVVTGNKLVSSIIKFLTFNVGEGLWTRVY